MNEIIVKENIKNMIYVIKGKEVMLDSDLAHLYGCKNGTKDINKAVKRNNERFPNDFCSEIDINDNRGTNIKYKPHVFTQEGLAMISSVIRTPVAAKTNIKIMREFVAMKKVLLQNSNIYREIIDFKQDVC